MERREFLTKAAIASICAKTIVLSSAQARNLGLIEPPLQPDHSLAQPSADLLEDMKSLLQWMVNNGWGDIIRQISGLTVNTNDPMDPLMFKKFNPNLSFPGCNDFIGRQLITPGLPQESLLYHLLASPRVKLGNNVSKDAYPSLEQIDVLENFVYSLMNFKAADINRNNMVLAVFAYEYRPAAKTPHGFHADLVYSRSAFSRIGSQPISDYDSVNRCFTNLPVDSAHESEIAVTPARYGLFLARRLGRKSIENNAEQVGDDKKLFLLPLRKIIKNDPLLSGYQLYFEESHRTEKLFRLCTNELVKLPANVFNLQNSPFVRKSSSSTNPQQAVNPAADKQLVQLTEAGSSVLLSSYPRPLVWRATQQVNGKEERLRVRIPAKSSFGVYSNRRYSTLKLIGKKAQVRDAIDIARNYLLAHNKIITDYHAPRNEPMFVNIREVVSEADGDHITHITEGLPDLLQQTNQEYWAGLFEDNICDGCISGNLNAPVSASAASLPAVTTAILRLKRLPAFSIVTAPDFFPLVGSRDMKDFESLFLSGGIQDMSGARLKGNPVVDLPFQTASAFPPGKPDLEGSVRNTVLAMITARHNPKAVNPGAAARLKEAESQTRTNFLPDSATIIFYPGWDVTYSDLKDSKGIERDLFYSTMGLGSPFVEDSKLCAAANGMWAAASPDSARTFRPTLTRIPLNGLPPTAVPLLDLELGYHPDSTAVKVFHKAAVQGWDGEYGPFLLKDGGTYKVNFTDINRSDYVQNALSNSFNMAEMRKITTAEVRNRMRCLKMCYDKLKINKTKIWLVGAERITDWETLPLVSCLPEDLIPGRELQVNAAAMAPAQGYVYVLVESEKDLEKITGTKRVLQPAEKIHVCLVNGSVIAICSMNSSAGWKTVWM